MESKGEAMVESDGGRGSYGGEKKWCRVLERVNSPGLVVAHVRVWLPMSACRFPCPRMVARVRTSLPASVCGCPCPRVVACVRTSLPMSVHVRGQAFLFMGVGGSLCWWAVSFICGQQHSGVVGSHWWVVVSPQGWCRCVVAWPLWSHCGARWCMSQLSCRHLVATSPAATWHLWLVSMKRRGGGLCGLPGLGTTWLLSSSWLHCGGHSMVVVDGLRCRCWWWWEGRSNDVATFEPCLLHLGSHVPRWAICCFSLSYSKALVAQLVRALLTLLWLRVQFPDIVKFFFT